MEFNYINQPDYDRERDGAVQEVLGEEWWKSDLPSIATFCKSIYNEGYKQALRDWGEWRHETQYIGSAKVAEIIKEVDLIDKGE